MARCNNDVLLKKIGVQKLTQSTEVEFRIRKDLPDCRKIDTKNFEEVSGDYSYNKYLRPENRFECGRKGCTTSGVLQMSAANETALYKVNYDATEFANGVVTFYVHAIGENLPATVTFKIGTEKALTNADVYTKTISAITGNDGFEPVMIDLSQAPSSTEGDGWEASANGAYIQLSANKTVGYSSIAFYDSIDDFEINDVVKVSCLSTIGGTYDVEMIEAACQDSQYNDQISSLTFPVTGTQATPNYWKLNPMLEKGSRDKGFKTITVEKTVGAGGVIVLPDLDQTVCGFVAVQMADSCNVTDATLRQISAPQAVALDEGSFQVIDNGGVPEIHFNASLAGMKVLVSYPTPVDIEEYVANPDNLGSTHVSMITTHKTDDGVEYVTIFENVFVTSFPATITNENTEFAFTLTIGRDDDGNFFRQQKILA